MHKFFMIVILLISSLSHARSLKSIKASKVLNILTRNAPTTYYLDKDGNPAGMDYDLGTALAKKLGVVANFIVKDTVNDILVSLKGGQGDVALAGLSKTIERQDSFLYSRPYQSVRQQVVCNKRFSFKSIEELSITVSKGTSYVQTLESLRRTNQKIQYYVSDKFNTEELLAHVWNSQVDCTLADSNIVSVVRRIYPELKIVKSLEYEGLYMLFSKESKELVPKANNLLTKLNKRGTLKEFEDRYYGHVKDFDYVDIKVFKRRIDKRLTKYKRLFKQAGKTYGLDWKLLAAISYQESHWNPLAKSPTGVRGMMMLTRATAKQMLVNNRLNAAESIFGGAKYLKHLISRIPKYIDSHDRLWLAVASYNVGYYHLRDARSIAIWREDNPNKWKDIKKSLPFLSKKKYYKRLPYGHARGHEPVLYVKRIRNYYDIITAHLKD